MCGSLSDKSHQDGGRLSGGRSGILYRVWCLCPLLPERCHKHAGKGEKNHPAENLQRFNGPFDERKGKNVTDVVVEEWKAGSKYKGDRLLSKKLPLPFFYVHIPIFLVYFLYEYN